MDPTSEKLGWTGTVSGRCINGRKLRLRRRYCSTIPRSHDERQSQVRLCWLLNVARDFACGSILIEWRLRCCPRRPRRKTRCRADAGRGHVAGDLPSRRSGYRTAPDRRQPSGRRDRRFEPSAARPAPIAQQESMTFDATGAIPPREEMVGEMILGSLGQSHLGGSAVLQSASSSEIALTE